MWWSGTYRRLGRHRSGRVTVRFVAVLAAFVVAVVGLGPIFAGALAPPEPTTSYYEGSASTKMLFVQGKLAGEARQEGIVILDFGRPAYDGATFGTLAYSGRFIPLSGIVAGVQSYIRGYYRWAPSYTSLDVAIGTNNSCGTGQPCGSIPFCGCPDEPPSFFVWGQELALSVLGTGAWARTLRASNGYTDDVRVVAADDAEPAYDPGFINTYDLLAGYASTVGGTFPAMVDYGSAESSFWTQAQLLQVAYGFAPDVPMPQIYYQDQAAQWGSLLRYAKARKRVLVRIFGVLTTGAGTNDPATAYADMLGAAAGVTAQGQIPWLSTIYR